MNLNTPIQSVSRIGPVFQKKLNRLGIHTVNDLIFHFPIRYEDFSNITAINKIKVNEKYCLAGKILDIKTSRTWKKKMYVTEAVIEDKTSAIRAVWFNQPYLTTTLKQGDNIFLAGKISLDKNGVFVSSPIYEKVSPNPTHTGRIIPVYPETAKLSSRWLRYILKPLLSELQNKIPETLPSKIIKNNGLLPINQAIWQVHFPDSLVIAEKAKSRFAFEQLFLIELAVLSQRIKLNTQNAPQVPFKIKLVQDLVSSLPFKLTDAQRKSTWQIIKDMEKASPMSRLLEGDVGSGKTVVALISAMSAVKNGFQVAFMAPTEILAKQHFDETSKLLQPFKIKIGLLTGKQDKIISQKIGYRIKGVWRPEIMEISRTKLLERTAKGEVDILVGTHALIQDKVKFGNLALAIIDEQHRFGVKQRAKMVAKGKNNRALIPHFLSITATPIPRTVALTVFGNLDLSVIDQNQKGRKKVITEKIFPQYRKKICAFVKKEVKKGNQVFVICPRIEKTENENDKNNWNEVKAVTEEHSRLSEKVFPDLKIEFLHGKMKPKEKAKIMQSFRNKKFDILVATSVVEVGVDIPNATVMLIEGAERFGLATLHQFRGRVGRSDKQSYCFLFTSDSVPNTTRRLQALVKAKNGFELAEKDLQIRGPGSLYGAKQWGIPDLAMETLRNLQLVESTRKQAKELLTESPNLKKYPALQAGIANLSLQIHLE